MVMNSQQPSSLEGETLFRAMAHMFCRYAERLAAGQSSLNVGDDIPGPNGTVSRNEAIAAAYQLAGYIAATTDPSVTPDPAQPLRFS